MERLTEKRGTDVLYIGKHARLAEIGENASTMKVAATRDVLQRLAEYEATGLDPEQVERLLSAAISCQAVKFIPEKPRGMELR